MPAADLFWHIAGFFSTAVLMGGLAAVLFRVLWRRELGPVGLLRLWAWAGSAAALAATAGLVVFGHDGKMATYAAMVVATAAALGWAGFRRRAVRPIAARPAGSGRAPR